MTLSRPFTYIAVIFLLISQGFAQQRIGIISSRTDSDLKELQVILEGKGYQLIFIAPDDLVETLASDSLDLIWLQTDRVMFGDRKSEISPPEKALIEFVSGGGSLVLAHKALELLNRWKIETTPVTAVLKEVKDQGYGRMLGFHSYRHHPVFDGLNGGTYVLRPDADTTVMCYGFFGKAIPDAGKVVAVDWDYIFLRENKKIIVEYKIGEGTIMGIGAYMHFSLPNRNSKHIVKFTGNVIRYLTSGADNDAFYWHYGKPVVQKFNPLLEKAQPVESKDWKMQESTPSLKNNFGRDDYWDLAGRRFLAMGQEKGGIEEAWAHPFMAFRDYEVGIRFSNKDTVFWLKDQVPEVAMSPGSFSRQYKFRRGFLKEIITTSFDEPEMVLHYEYRGVYPAELVVRFRSNLRLMWPYSSEVTRGIYYGWAENTRSFVITDPSGDLVSMIGCNQEPAYRFIGRVAEDNISDSLMLPVPDTQMIISGLMIFDLEMNHDLDVITAAGNEGMKKIAGHYLSAGKDPYELYLRSTNNWNLFLRDALIIESPDPVFNEGYLWALLGTERFFVETPGLGTSLTAGYASTAHGWDGGHAVSGRPGYAWYFGRDAEWSALAVLGYGGHEGARKILETFNRFQDLNGKIFHEMSTSGFVHYDASDATPLYLVLAGRYLQHSGDTEFIDTSWAHIQKAIDFCYSTDTDNDLLIENTNVGHGWVEGGSLFGSHTSLYLASCWAAALEASAYMARETGRTSIAEKYTADAVTVRTRINRLYWDEENKFFRHGMKEDGSFIEEPTIMPSIPLMFGQVDQDKISPLLDAYARNAFTADWGCRIVTEFSPLFNPRGYHTGSVWPLYTGWVSLAEYRNGHYNQGYFHLMNNLSVYDDWGHGFVEEVLNGEEYLPSGVCHHQCWSETMVLQPAIEGMLGFRPDAPNDRFILAPRFPADWDHVNVRNIRSGSDVIDFSMERKDGKITYTFVEKEGDGAVIWFNPAFLPGTRVKDVLIMETGVKPARKLNTDQAYPVGEFMLHPEASLTLEITYEGGIAAIPPIPVVKPGYRSKGFRIVDEKMLRGEYRILVEGRSNSRETLDIISYSEPQVEEGAILLEQIGENRYRLQVDFADRESDYADHWIIIKTD